MGLLNGFFPRIFFKSRGKRDPAGWVDWGLGTEVLKPLLEVRCEEELPSLCFGRCCVQTDFDANTKKCFDAKWLNGRVFLLLYSVKGRACFCTFISRGQCFVQELVLELNFINELQR